MVRILGFQNEIESCNARHTDSSNMCPYISSIPTNGIGFSSLLSQIWCKAQQPAHREVDVMGNGSDAIQHGCVIL